MMRAEVLLQLIDGRFFNSFVRQTQRTGHHLSLVLPSPQCPVGLDYLVTVTAFRETEIVSVGQEFLSGKAIEFVRFQPPQFPWSTRACDTLVGMGNRKQPNRKPGTVKNIPVPPMTSHQDIDRAAPNTMEPEV